MDTADMSVADTVDLTRINHLPRRAFDYGRLNYANAAVYRVYGFGGGSGDVGADSAVLGFVARLHDVANHSWWATPDTGQVLRWWGPFTTRTDAARVLLGARIERYLPALRTDLSGTETPRAQILDRERVESIVDDLLKAVRDLRSHEDDFGNDEEIQAGQNLADEVEAACAELTRMVKPSPRPMAA